MGDADAIILAAHARSAHERAQVQVLEGVGHSPHMEQAGRFNELLARFLQEAAVSSR